MAEGILRDKVAARGLAIKTDSAGTGNYHIGEAPDKRALAKMKEKGHNISDLRARQFESLDYDRFDRIFVMDQSNYQNTLRVAHSPLDEDKVSLMLNETHPNENREVPDPYFGGDDGFEDVYQMLDKACEAFLNSLNGQG